MLYIENQMFVCVFIYGYTGERQLILLLLNYMEISVISMSHIHTGSLMILKCAPLLDKRGKKDQIAAVVIMVVSMDGLELIC